MPDIFYLLSKWWKQMLMMILLCLLTVGIITFFKPRQYLSVTTAVPANVVATDKARIFSENIEGLYSNLGSPDDLDMIVGTAQLDTVYLAVIDEFNLFDHYKISSSRNVRARAARLLKKYSRVMKSEYGELQVKVWDTDKDLAPQLADAIMNKLSAIHSGLQNVNNRQVLQSLLNAIKRTQVNIDSLNILQNQSLTAQSSEPYTVRRKVLLGQLEEYQKLAGEYQLLTDSGSQLLLVAEKARPAIRPDKPEWVQIMTAAAFLSLVFALLVALLMEKRKTTISL